MMVLACACRQGVVVNERFSAEHGASVQTFSDEAPAVSSVAAAASTAQVALLRPVGPV